MKNTNIEYKDFSSYYCRTSTFISSQSINKILTDFLDNIFFELNWGKAIDFRASYSINLCKDTENLYFISFNKTGMPCDIRTLIFCNYVPLSFNIQKVNYIFKDDILKELFYIINSGDSIFNKIIKSWEFAYHQYHGFPNFKITEFSYDYDHKFLLKEITDDTNFTPKWD